MGVLIQQTTNEAYKYCCRLDISLWTLFLAFYTSTGRQGGPSYSTTEHNNQFPTDWWRWAWIDMVPTFGVRAAGLVPQFNVTDIFNWLGRYQVFKHNRTSLAVLNTTVGPSTDAGPLPNMTSILASLLSQDNYFKFNNEHDPHNVSQYLTFMQLSALGAPWAFPPGQRGSKGGLFNHHSMVGTNDPQADPWLPLVPPRGETDIANQPIVTQMQKVIGSLHLALFLSITPSGAAGTAVGKGLGSKVENTWALIRIKSSWTLGNLRPLERMGIQWMQTRASAAGDTCPGPMQT